MLPSLLFVSIRRRTPGKVFCVYIVAQSVNTAEGWSATWKPTHNAPASSSPHPGLKAVCATSSAKAGTFVLYYRHSKQRIFVSSSLAVIMKFYYCSGFICLLMNMNVVSLFPTLPASLSQGASRFHSSVSFPCLASPAGRAGWAAVTAASPGTAAGRGCWSKPGCWCAVTGAVWAQHWDFPAWRWRAVG